MAKFCIDFWWISATFEDFDQVQNGQFKVSEGDIVLFNFLKTVKNSEIMVKNELPDLDRG